MRSNANDSTSGTIEFTSNSNYPITIDGDANAKILLQGSASPYIRWRENTTDKAYIQWSTSGFLGIYNQESAESLRIGSGESGLVWRVGSSNRTVWTSGNDGSGSGLDSDLLDGQHGSYYRNADVINNGTVNVNRLGSSGTRNSSHFLAGDNVWRAVTTDLVNDTTPQLGGHLDVNAKNINFADSGTFGTDDTLRFGASNDFNIFHGSGSNTVATYRNKNILKTQGSAADLLVELGGGTHNSGFSFTERGAGGNLRTLMTGGWYGAISLYHQGTKRIETTSTGGKITGKLETTSTGTKIPCSDVTSGVTKVLVETANSNEVKHANNNAIRTFLGIGETDRCRITVKTTVGTGNHTTQSWCTHLIAIVNGGGGAGGNARGTGLGGYGGNGGQAFNYRDQLSGATTIPYKVGAGGSLHASGSCDDGASAGGNGGQSYFGPTSNRATANGGSGGGGANSGQRGADGSHGGTRFFMGDYGQGGRGGQTAGGGGDDGGCSHSGTAGGKGAIWILELG